MWTVRRPSGFSDVRCDARTIEGGPGAEAVAPGDSTLYTCKHGLLAFANFPNAPGNTVSELVYVDGQLLISTSFSFDGPNGSNTLTLTLPAGHHSIDVRARWKTNGVSGGHDQHLEGGLRCKGEPES